MYKFSLPYSTASYPSLCSRDYWPVFPISRNLWWEMCICGRLFLFFIMLLLLYPSYHRLFRIRSAALRVATLPLCSHQNTISSVTPTKHKYSRKGFVQEGENMRWKLHWLLSSCYPTSTFLWALSPFHFRNETMH